MTIGLIHSKTDCKFPFISPRKTTNDLKNFIETLKKDQKKVLDVQTKQRIQYQAHVMMISLLQGLLNIQRSIKSVH